MSSPVSSPVSPARWCNPFRFGRAFPDVAEALGAACSRSVVLLPRGGITGFPVHPRQARSHARNHARNHARSLGQRPGRRPGLARRNGSTDLLIEALIEVRIEGDRLRISRENQPVRLVFSLNSAAREVTPVFSAPGVGPRQWIHAPAGSPVLVAVRLSAGPVQQERFRCVLDACLHLAATGFDRPDLLPPPGRRLRGRAAQRASS